MPRAEERIRLYPSPKRVRAMFGGETVAESQRTLLLLEKGHAPVYYFPRDDVHVELLARSDKHTHCPYKGDARYWTVAAGDKRAEDAAWSYEAPIEGMEDIAKYVAFYFGRMDAWYEEDEKIVVHPRSPYHRVDVLESRRPVRVEIGGQVVAETKNARFLFETDLPARYYIPQEDVKLNLLTDSAKTSACPYKGSARYWSAKVGDEVREDVAWSYPLPLPEVRKIAGLVCFYPERVDVLTVDGKSVKE
jgi:uncharacterized protein (DUF427 family)